MRSAASAAIALCLAAPALADVVHLKGGGRLAGRVEDDGERVRVVMAGGTMTFARDRIERIERQETPPEEVSRRRGALAERDAAGAVALARFAGDANLVAERGELLELAASWAPDDAAIRAELDRWRVFERPLPASPAAEEALALSVGGDAGVYRTAHWRIAFRTDVAVARRRGELLEAAWRKFEGLVAKAGVAVRPIADRMECVVYRDHDEWSAAANLPAGGATDLVGVYVASSRRILLYDTRTSPAAQEVGRALAQAFASLDDARAAVAARRDAVSQVERALADAESARRPDETRIAALREWLGGARKSLTQADEDIAARETDLARYRDDAGRHFTGENVSSTTHEACHQIAFALGVSRAGQPVWLVEGLATLFEPESRTNFVLEAPNAPRLRDVRSAWSRGDGGDVRRVLGDAIFDAKDRGPRAYAESWALTYFLANRRSAELARYLELGALLPPGAGSAPARVADFQRFFGDDLDALEREWRGYIGRL